MRKRGARSPFGRRGARGLLGLALALLWLAGAPRASLGAPAEAAGLACWSPAPAAAPASHGAQDAEPEAAGAQLDPEEEPPHGDVAEAAHAFLKNLALVLCVAAVATVIFQRLRQPVVFGYLLAGLIIGPHVPIPLLVDVEMVRTLAELGVILLMFSLGMEFSLRKLIAIGPTAGLVAVAQSGTLVVLGFGLGRLFGWTTTESLYAGAIIAISSTTIIVKAFAEQGVRGRAADIVFGILIIEDLVAIFLLVILTAVSSPGGLTPAALGITAVRLATFLAGLIGAGLWVMPRLMRAVVRLDRPETTLVASVGICFAFALVALSFGYSVALGAFLAGSLIAESGVEKAVEPLIEPVRDLFAAIFFVSVGILIDPVLIAEHWVAVLAFTAVVIAGKVLAVSGSAFLTGLDVRTSVQVGMSLGQIGEFSFIIAGLGLTSGATRDFLYPVAIAVSAITTLTTPWLIRSAEPAAAYVDRKLPRPLQTYVALYGSWVERLRAAPRERGARWVMRRLAGLVLLDLAVLAGLIVGAALELDRLAPMLSGWTGMAEDSARLILILAASLIAAPLVFGGIRTARLLGLALASRALPQVAAGAVDFSAAPRRALTTTFQLAIVLASGLALVAVTSPFLPPLRGFAFLAGIVAVLFFAFWRSATNLQGHARAGAEILASALARPAPRAEPPQREEARRQKLAEVLQGLGQPVAWPLPEDSPGLGRSLAQLNLRGRTGATVLAITRDGKSILIPGGREVLQAGDVLAIAGTRAAVEAAQGMLAAPVP